MMEGFVQSTKDDRERSEKKKKAPTKMLLPMYLSQNLYPSGIPSKTI